MKFIDDKINSKYNKNSIFEKFNYISFYKTFYYSCISYKLSILLINLLTSFIFSLHPLVNFIAF
jgi:hypothetical protein